MWPGHDGKKWENKFQVKKQLIFLSVILMSEAILLHYILYSSPVTGCNTAASFNAEEAVCPKCPCLNKQLNCSVVLLVIFISHMES